MSRVLTNNAALQYTIETAIGVAGTDWFVIEPNSFGTIGATITTVARDPISKLRQRRKGTITDLDSAADFEADLTLSHFTDFAEGFVFAKFQGAEVFNPTEVTGGPTDEGYIVDIGSELVVDTLVYARNFEPIENNGLKVVNGTPTTTFIPVNDDNLTTEVTVQDNATVEVAGFRYTPTDLVVTLSGNTVILTAGTAFFLNAGLDIQPGQMVYIDGTNFPTPDSNTGYARVVSVTATVLVIDKTSQQWVAETNTGDIDIYIGRFLKNVPTDDGLFLEQSYQFEVTYPDLDGIGSDAYEYSVGNYCNTLAIALPLTDKSTMSFGFIGTDTDVPTTSRKTGADTAELPTRTAAFNTTQDVARLRVTEVDETGLTTDFKSATITLNNNVSPEKVLGTLGARYMNYGNFEVDLEGQVLFTDDAVVSAIRNNTTVSMDFILQNDDGAIGVDIPSMTLGGGGKDFPTNESVLLNLTGMAFVDEILDASIAITTFAYIPQD